MTVKTEPERPHPSTSPEGVEHVVKKPYEKPSFRFERVFETTALSCGKVQVTQAGCRANRKAS
jgi:hypothetical protein